MDADKNKIKEIHPLEPFLPQGAKILVLGSFPPPKVRWSMEFYYPNLINDFWRIMGLIFFENKEYFLTEDRKRFDRERVIGFAAGRGIAMCDTAREVVRIKDNASDQFLHIVESVDLAGLLGQIPECMTVVTTGQKATETLRAITGSDEPSMGSFVEFDFDGRRMSHYRMPSTSRAYPKPLSDKADAYKSMFIRLGMI